MSRTLTDSNLLRLVLSGCNANEIAAWAETSVEVAEARISHVLAKHAAPTCTTSRAIVPPSHENRLEVLP